MLQFILQKMQTVKTNITEFRNISKSVHVINLHSITQNNCHTVYLAGFLAFLLQLMNLYRVFSTQTKLSSLNNRIYFYFYIVMIFASVFFCVAQHYAKLQPHKLYWIQYFAATFYVLWNLFLNYYGLQANKATSITLFMSAFIFTSLLLRLHPIHSCCLLIGSYGIFAFLLRSIPWESFDCAIIAVVAMCNNAALYVRQVHATHQRMKIQEMNQKLQTEEEMLRFNLEKYRLITNETHVFSFDWDLVQDVVVPSRDCATILNLPTHITKPRVWMVQHGIVFEEDHALFNALINQCVRNKRQDGMELRLKNSDGTYAWYQLLLFVQYSDKQHATNILGILKNIDSDKRLVQNLYNQLTVQMNGSKEYLRKLKTAQDKVFIYQHDIRHSLTLMQQLAKQGDMQKMQAYLSISLENLDAIQHDYYCENETVNLILGAFDQIAKTSGLTFTTDVTLPADLPMDDTKLCALFFNLLENAHFAAQKTKTASERSVYIKAVFRKKQLVLLVENGYCKPVVMREGLPISSKEQECHGFGIKSILDVVDYYQGHYSFEPLEEVFQSKILLYLE